MHQHNNKQQQPGILNWQIAYAARDLRHNKSITLSCLKSEASTVLEQISSFSNTSQITATTISKPNSNEVFLEIAERT